MNESGRSSACVDTSAVTTGFEPHRRDGTSLTRVRVLGGGPARMTAALHAAELGDEVTHPHSAVHPSAMDRRGMNELLVPVERAPRRALLTVLGGTGTATRLPLGWSLRSAPRAHAGAVQWPPADAAAIGRADRVVHVGFGTESTTREVQYPGLPFIVLTST